MKSVDLDLWSIGSSMSQDPPHSLPSVVGLQRKRESLSFKIAIRLYHDLHYAGASSHRGCFSRRRQEPLRDPLLLPLSVPGIESTARAHLRDANVVETASYQLYVTIAPHQLLVITLVLSPGYNAQPASHQVDPPVDLLQKGIKVCLCQLLQQRLGLLLKDLVDQHKQVDGVGNLQQVIGRVVVLHVSRHLSK